MILYSLSDITRTFGEKTVLDISSLELEKGSIYALLGPNGAGKTTLLNILSFLNAPSSGSVHFNGNRVKFSEKHLYPLRKQVVLLPQHPIMFSTTVHKNIEFGLKTRNIPKPERRKIIEEALEMVGMRHFANEKASHLSGGETQRISFARAIALSPKVILCDEPTANVDLENQAIITNILTDINSEKKITLIFTSHDQLKSSLLAQHKIFIEHGKLADAYHDNLFTGDIVEHMDQYSMCLVQNTMSLKIPRATTGKVRFQIDPNKITLSETNGENTISGRISQITYENNHIRIILNAGAPISMLLSVQTYSDMKGCFTAGNTINVHIPSSAIRILS